MRAKLPLLRNHSIPPARAPVLRYGVAVLSIILALIPAFLLSDVVESRLVVFAVAIMLDVNPALVTMLGYATASELVGRNVANLYSDSQQWFGLADFLRELEKFHGLPADWVRRDHNSINVRLSGRDFSEKGDTK